jgi:nitrogen-specific signal transduction histidine kinase
VFDEPEDIPPILSDESKVSQILRNFIPNALKYTERGAFSRTRGSRSYPRARSPPRRPRMSFVRTSSC